jgi:hypothetical protein
MYCNQPSDATADGSVAVGRTTSGEVARFVVDTGSPVQTESNLNERSAHQRSCQQNLCCATFHNLPLAPYAERQAQSRGAATEVVGEILYVANSMVPACRDTSQEKGQG